ncbi:MAG TPA: hypothetical protein VNZ49_09540 [Bacteroidia bacterium]|jgi:hypothetical protein|nr:hypothetical protein [Bacteroidia bacterium]
MFKTHLLLLLLCFFFQQGFTQQEKLGQNNGNIPTTDEVVIGIPNLRTQTQLTNLKTSLSGLNGVTWSGYCDDQHYVLIKVNRFIQADNKNITDAILALNKEYKIYYKITSFAQALNVCMDKDKALLK